MILLNRNWNGGKVEFKINGSDFKFDSSKGIQIEEHAFNNSGSTIKMSGVYPATYTKDNLVNNPFKLPKYSRAEIKVDGQLIIDGFIKKQESLNLDPFKPKYIDITIVTKKEFLTQLPMDFPIIGMKYEAIVDKILEKLNMSNIFVKGDMSFLNGIIRVYDGKNKTAFDMLQVVSDQSDTALVIKDLDDGTSQINFYNRNDILSGLNHNRGVSITYDTKANKQAWWNLYRVTAFSGKENNLKDVNFVRVESEKVISTKSQTFEEDLSIGNSSVSTQFPIGSLDRIDTKLLNPDRSVNRKLVISTNSQKKAADLVYSPNTNTITINTRIIGKNLILKISYKPILRESFDKVDTNDQNEIATRTGTNGVLYRYEKQNDITKGEDLIDLGEKYIKAGVDSKLIWTIKSRLPIWEIGQFLNFIGDSELDALDLTGGYIVREAQIIFKDSGEGIQTKEFTYTLVKTIDLQNEWNYYDSLARRDKTFIDNEALTTEGVRTTNENVFIEILELDKTCSTVGASVLERELESSLRFDGNQYPIFEI